MIYSQVMLIKLLDYSCKVLDKFVKLSEPDEPISSQEFTELDKINQALKIAWMLPNVSQKRFLIAELMKRKMEQEK